MARSIFFLVGVLALLSTGLVARELRGAEPASTPPIYATGRGAIDGVDPVAYFSEGRVVRGDPDLWHDWRGARWHFASHENREQFLRDPERFAPQFGGYCAYGVASGYTVKSDPDAWSIWRGRLYLNYDREVQEEWSADREALVERAEANWPAVLE